MLTMLNYLTESSVCMCTCFVVNVQKHCCGPLSLFGQFKTEADTGYSLYTVNMCRARTAASVCLYLFPPPYTRGSTHMSSSGVESMIS